MENFRRANQVTPLQQQTYLLSKQNTEDISKDHSEEDRGRFQHSFTIMIQCQSKDQDDKGNTDIFNRGIICSSSTTSRSVHTHWHEGNTDEGNNGPVINGGKKRIKGFTKRLKTISNK